MQEEAECFIPENKELDWAGYGKDMKLPTVVGSYKWLDIRRESHYWTNQIVKDKEGTVVVVVAAVVVVQP